MAARGGLPIAFMGHPTMFGMVFAETPPADYRGWAETDHDLYDAVAVGMHRRGAMPEPDSREPWFMCEAHGLDPSCLTDTLKAVEVAVDLTLEQLA